MPAYVFSDEHEVADFWRVDLFELASDEHRSHTDELQVAPKNLGARKVAVDEIHRDV